MASPSTVQRGSPTKKTYRRMPQEECPSSKAGSLERSLKIQAAFPFGFAFRWFRDFMVSLLRLQETKSPSGVKNLWLRFYAENNNQRSEIHVERSSRAFGHALLRAKNEASEPGVAFEPPDVSKPQLWSSARDFMSHAWSSLVLWIGAGWFGGGLPWCVGLIGGLEVPLSFSFLCQTKTLEPFGLEVAFLFSSAFNPPYNLSFAAIGEGSAWPAKA